MARAGQAMLSMSGRAVLPRVTVMPAWRRAELTCAGEGEAARDPRGLGGLPREEAGGLGGSEGGGEEMDADAALRGVKAEAGLGVGAIGDFGAAVAVDGGIRLAGGDDGDAARGEHGTEADAEGQGDGFFRDGGGGGIFEGAAGVVAAVGGIEDDDEAVGGRGLGEGGDAEGEGDEGGGDSEPCSGGGPARMGHPGGHSIKDSISRGHRW